MVAKHIDRAVRKDPGVKTWQKHIYVLVEQLISDSVPCLLIWKGFPLDLNLGPWNLCYSDYVQEKSLDLVKISLELCKLYIPKICIVYKYIKTVVQLIINNKLLIERYCKFFYCYAYCYAHISMCLSFSLSNNSKVSVRAEYILYH